MENAPIEILLIEDDLAQAALIREMLAGSRKPEFSVRHVRYLEEGLGLVRSRMFDVVLVDLGLPDSQGLETALAVRHQSRLAPVIILTSLSDEDAALTAFQMDIQDYLFKGEITGPLLQRSIRYAIQRKRDSEALRQSEERFRALVTASSEVLYVMGPDWSEMRLLYSERFLDRTERPSANWLQKYIPPEDQSYVTTAIQEAIRRKGIFELEHRVIRADGSFGWTVSRAVPLMAANGDIIEWFGAASDITERRETEEALRKSEMKFAKIFHAVPVLIGISTLEEGRYVDVNQTALKLLGYGRDEVIGRTAQELNLWEDPSVQASVLRALKEQGGVENLEVRIRGKSGQIFTGLYSAEIVDFNGDRYRLGLVKDITERKQAELEREHTLLQLESVLESITEGVMIADLAGNVVMLNREAAAILGFETIEQGYRPLAEYLEIFELFDLEGRLVPFEKRPLSLALRGERFVNHQVRVRRKDTGKSLIASYSGTPVKAKSGETFLAVVTIRDITDQKAAEEALRKSEQKFAKIFKLGSGIDPSYYGQGGKNHRRQ